MTLDLLAQAAPDPGAVSTGEAVVFWILGPISLLGALSMVFARNAVHSALGLIATMFSLAILYIVQQAPFLFRFNAYPEAHLDSLENPAYAAGFEHGEGRVFLLPTFSGVRGLQTYQSALGPGGSLLFVIVGHFLC